MRVVFTKRSVSDLSEIVGFVADDNPDAARELQAGLLESLTKLADNPRLGRPGRVEHTRELVVHSSYIAAYRITENAVEILTVRHTARLWPDKM